MWLVPSRGALAQQGLLEDKEKEITNAAERGETIVVLPLLETSLRSAAFGYIFLDMVKIHILLCLVDRGTAGGNSSIAGAVPAVTAHTGARNWTIVVNMATIE